MKLIIAGTRNLWPSYQFVDGAIRLTAPYADNGPITEIVCGGAEGVDNEGAHWASHYNVPVKYFRPNWDEYGRAAGPMRNKQMAEYADVLLLIWDGESRGSASMKSEMEKLGKPVFEVIVRGPSIQHKKNNKAISR